MEDNETVVEQEEQTEITEEVNSEETEQTPVETIETEEDETVVTIGEETPPQEEKEAPEWVKELRVKQKETAKENKRLAKELEGFKSKQTQTVKLGEKPTLANCDYEEEAYETALEKWHEDKRKVDLQEASKRAAQAQQEEEWNNTVQSYEEKKKSLKVKDYSSSEETVQTELNETQQGILLAATQNPAVVVYAIGKNETALKKLSSIKDPIKFAAEVARLETTMKTTTRKKAPAPEARVTGGGSIGIKDAKLAKLQEEAYRSGDFSRLTAYKKQLKKG